MTSVIYKISQILLFFNLQLPHSRGIDHKCDGFMVLLAGKYPWKSAERCTDSFIRLAERIRVLSFQMTSMNSTLTVFSTYEKTESCDFKMPNVIVEQFNAKELLISYGFQDVLPIMNSWSLKSYTRTSDILRILLAHKYKKVYLDTDVHVLNMTKSLFMQPFVGAAVWSDSKCALEISNSAFCLPLNVLQDMIEFIHRRIKLGNSMYQYTELGPSMFHKILLNKFSIPLYSQNHPAESSLDKLADHIKLYHHNHLHLTGKIRKGNPDLTYLELIQSIRIKGDLTPLDIIVPESSTIAKNKFPSSTLRNFFEYTINLGAFI